MPSTKSVTDIVNMALTKLGEPPIADITDIDEENAVTMNRIYEIVRDRLLRENPWNFAVKRDTLAADGTDPIYGFDKRYAYPADLLSFLSTENDRPYRLEGNFIHSNDTTLKIRYTARIVDPSQFDTYFVEALASLLAYEASFRISNSIADKSLFLQEHKESLINAKRYDGIEDAPYRVPEDDWLAARRGTGLEGLPFNTDDGGGSL